MATLKSPPDYLLTGTHSFRDRAGGIWAFQDGVLRIKFAGESEEELYSNGALRGHEVLIYRDTRPGYKDRVQLRQGKNERELHAELRGNMESNEFDGLWELISFFLLTKES